MRAIWEYIQWTLSGMGLIALLSLAIVGLAFWFRALLMFMQWVWPCC
jgi:hypothetical protein